MSNRVSTELPVAAGLQRVIGQVVADTPGPTLLCTGSLHGNEPAGLRALERVFSRLRADRPPIRGEVIGLLGNLTAVARGQRFVDSDLNRLWSPEKVIALRTAGPSAPEDTEEREAAELLAEIDSVVARARGPVFCVDLHTTSGPSPPFATVSDTLRNRRFALHFPVPIVLGLEEHLDHTLLGYLDLGCLDGNGRVTMGFEGGQHLEPAANDHCEACVWIALAESGVLESPDSLPAVLEARDRLSRTVKDLPKVVEVRHRYALKASERFLMLPGYVSFQPITESDVLAKDARGDVRPPEAGRILMPLYQRQGDDGFFVVCEFRPFWLTVSALLRHLRMDAALHWLPGISRDPDRPHTLRIDRRVARFYALQIFHLLGYRRRRIEDGTLLVTRRRE